MEIRSGSRSAQSTRHQAPQEPFSQRLGMLEAKPAQHGVDTFADVVEYCSHPEVWHPLADARREPIASAHSVA